jgi:hypothetical protein
MITLLSRDENKRKEKQKEERREREKMRNIPGSRVISLWKDEEGEFHD